MPFLDPQERVEAIKGAWTIGRLRYKLEPQQRKVYDIMSGAVPEEPFVVVCSRGFGKTFIGCTKVLEAARQFSNVNILIISSTLKNLRKIVKPAFDTLLEDCPEEFKPKWNAQDSSYEFPNGVFVHLVAAEKGHIEKIRGLHRVVYVLIDEAAFFGDEEDSFPLDHVIENIINPMFLRTQSKARIVMTSTPPEVPNHPFKEYFLRSKLANSCATFTIYESDIPLEKIEEDRRRCKNEIAWRRERLCEWIIDEDRMIIPEWKEDFVKAYEKDAYFPYWDKYFSCDIGTVDKTVGLFAFYDLKNARIHVVDEVSFEGRAWTTQDLANQIWMKEEEHWGQNPKVYRRVGDNNNQILLSDLTTLHRLPIIPTSKDTLQAMVNEARMWVRAGRVTVDPKAKLLIETLKNGIWNKSKDEFGQSKNLGHMDAIAALIYLIRNIDTQHNPVPATFGFDPSNQYWDQKPSETKVIADALIKDNPFLKQVAI